MAPTLAAVLWGPPRCYQQRCYWFLPGIVLLVLGAPLAVAWLLVDRAPRYCVLPAGLALAAAAVADVLLGQRALLVG